MFEHCETLLAPLGGIAVALQVNQTVYKLDMDMYVGEQFAPMAS